MLGSSGGLGHATSSGVESGPALWAHPRETPSQTRKADSVPILLCLRAIWGDMGQGWGGEDNSKSQKLPSLERTVVEDKSECSQGEIINLCSGQRLHANRM